MFRRAAASKGNPGGMTIVETIFPMIGGLLAAWLFIPHRPDFVFPIAASASDLLTLPGYAAGRLGEHDSFPNLKGATALLPFLERAGAETGRMSLDLVYSASQRANRA